MIHQSLLLGNWRIPGAAAQLEGMDLDDPELLQAMEIFANMSPDEMEDVLKELQMVLGDDPEALEAMREVMEELPAMKAADIQRNLKNLVEQDEIAKATADALDLLRKGEWNAIWARRQEILDAVISSGKIDPEDAARFRSDPSEWEAELKHIWGELQKLAAQEDSNEL